MKDEEIIALAEKSGCEGSQLTHDGAYNFVFTEETLIVFARAIADLQKEKDAKICLRQDGMHDQIYADAIRSPETDLEEWLRRQ